MCCKGTSLVLFFSLFFSHFALGGVASDGCSRVLDTRLKDYARNAKHSQTTLDGGKYQEIHYAVMNDDFEAIQAILEKDSTQIHARSFDGSTVLHVAITDDDSELSARMVTFLRLRGANPNTTDNNGNTPLHLAAQNGAIQAARALRAEIPSKANAALDFQNSFGNTPLIDAVDSRRHLVEFAHDEVSDFLISEGADVRIANNIGVQAIHLISSAGPVSLLIKIVAAGADPDAIAWNKKTRQGTRARPLHFAASNGQVLAIAVLVTAGAWVDAQDINGETPLHYAVYDIQLNAEKLLRFYGARKNIRAAGKNIRAAGGESAFGLKNFTPAQLANRRYAVRKKYPLTPQQRKDLRQIAKNLGIKLVARR